MIENEIFINKKIWKNFNEQELEEYKDKVFDYYRRKGFPYFYLTDLQYSKEFKKIKQFRINSLVKPDNILSQNMLGLNVVNSFMPHMWSTKTLGFKTPMDTFINDDLFKKAIDKRIKYGDNISDAGIRKVLSWSQGTHRVSNFRPTIAKYLYNTYGGEVNLDFSSGYGGRLFGFLGSDKTDTYIGVEPNLKTYNGLLYLAATFKHDKKIILYNEAFEDLELDVKVDFSFSSPPYFNTEEYAYDDKQSFVRYRNAHEWREKFLKVLINKNFELLKEEGIFAINIANVRTYSNLEEDTIEISKETGFKLIKTYKMALSNLHGSGFKYEPIFIFKK